MFYRPLVWLLLCIWKINWLKFFGIDFQLGGGGVAGAWNGLLVNQVACLRQDVGGDVEAGGNDVVGQVLQAGRSWNGDDVVGLGEDPIQGELGGGAACLVG